MNFTFHRKRVAGVLTVLPANERSFVDDMRSFNFPEARSLRLKEVMGYDKRRVVQGDVCVSDLAVFGLRHLFENGLLRLDEIDALLVFTQTPDHLMPPTSNIIQGRLRLKQDLLCLDISQGCAGFVIGLIEAFLLLEQESIRRVVLINADVLSRKVSPRDRNIYPLIGDAAALTVLERDAEDSVIHANLKMDGTRSDVLMIPAGGLRMPATPATAVLEDAGDNNLRAKDHLRMDGAAVFNFSQTDVPPLIENLLAHAGVRMETVDYFLCHQPNRFMLQKLADKLKTPYEKMPNSLVERVGNNGSATIPTLLSLDLRECLRRERRLVCLVGFGVGLSWSAMLLGLGPLDFNQVINYP